jgi:hypothetical protein
MTRLSDASRDGGHIHMHVTALRAMAQRMVHNHHSQKRLGNGRSANTHAWVMPPFSDHLNSLAVLVD